MTTLTAERVLDRITGRENRLAEARRSFAGMRQALRLAGQTARAYEQAQTDASRREVVERFQAGVSAR